MPSPVNEYLCQWIAKDFAPDGDYGKAVWADKPEIVFRQNRDGAEARQPTVARMCFSDAYLYIIWKNVDSYLLATMHSFNDLIYNEEACEAFIDDDNDLVAYQEFQVSPNNTQLHYLVQNDLKNNHPASLRSFARLEQVCLSAVKEIPGGWVAEMAIPMEEFRNARNNPPRNGDSWRINLFRIDRGEAGPQDDEYLTWQPNHQGSFHADPRVFGWLRFVRI